MSSDLCKRIFFTATCSHLLFQGFWAGRKGRTLRDFGDCIPYMYLKYLEHLQRNVWGKVGVAWKFSTMYEARAGGPSNYWQNIGHLGFGVPSNYWINVWLSQVDKLSRVAFHFCPKPWPSAAPWQCASFGIIFFQIRHFLSELWSESGWTGLSTCQCI